LLFSFFFELVEALFVVDMLEEEDLFAIVGRAEGMVLLDILDGVRLRKGVFMLRILQG